MIQFRGADLPESLRGVVFSRFLRSLKHGNDYFRLIQNDSYYKVYQKYLESLLKRPKTHVKFAVLSDDFDNVLGFSIVEDDKLHYCHVHKDQRRQGIARSLCSDPIRVITQITHIGAVLWNNKIPHAVFDPFE